MTSRERAALFAALTTGETVAEFAGRWMRDYARPAVSTCKTYEVTVAKFVRAFGERAMDDITPARTGRFPREISQRIAPRALSRTARTPRGNGVP